MHIDPALPVIVGVILSILLIGFALRAMGQPQIVGYIIAGLAIGPHGIGLLEDVDTISRIGSIGLIVLLFFVGMEASPRSLLKRWQVAIFGVVLQVLATVAVVWALSGVFGWTLPQVLIVGFVISLSSTAVVLKLLKDWNEQGTQTGQNVLVLLLAQDMVLVPMIIAINMMGGEVPAASEIIAQLIGAVILIGIAAWVFTRDHVRLPFAESLQADHELQVFAALMLCFGLALISGELGLSTALGAFVAGLVVSSARETDWVQESLEPFRIVFVAVFFVSVGMLIDVDYVREHVAVLAMLVTVVVLLNTGLNTAILRFLGSSWRRAAYAGALLSQIGEFSFILAALAHAERMIPDDDYRMIVAVIAISLMLSPAWIGLCKALLGHPEGTPDRPRIS
ncbi:MAG: cation:proton antiporter [Woeseia sp.]|jgi:CPA2 family monovalent cation:H+ antiporter-2